MQRCKINRLIADTKSDDEGDDQRREQRADRLTGKYARIAMVANPAMLGALHRQYDGDWNGVITGSIEELPAHYTDADLEAWLQQHFGREVQAAGMPNGVEQLSERS